MSEPGIDETGRAPAFRRMVFYVPGYDPFPARRYRELYRREGAEQARLAGYALQMTALPGLGPYAWRVETVIDGQRTDAQVEVMVWSDLVQASMQDGVLATYYQMLRSLVVYLGSGALFRMTRLRKGPVLAGFYPVLMLLGQLAVALALGALAVGLARWMLAALGPGLFPGLALLPGAGVVWLVLEAFRRSDGPFFAYYLMHDLAYCARWFGAYPDALERRMATFRQSIGTALGQGWDEVLVVGHSSGAHLAVSILADLIRAGERGQGPALGFLSLGHVVPMMSFLPRARRLRGDLHYLCSRPEITWVDVSAPGDGCCFALCDPVAVTGVAPPDKRWPLVVSAAFTQSLSAARWKELRWRFFRLHFQYLCAFDRPGDYDYFRITAGPVTLAARYAGRAPSKSRIETPVSGFRSWLP